MTPFTPDDLATLPVWAAAEIRRQAEEIAALRAALDGAERVNAAARRVIAEWYAWGELSSRGLDDALADLDALVSDER